MNHTVFIDENNDVYVFGNNSYGQCIPDSDQEFIINPTKLDIKAISVAYSNQYTIIVTTDGKVYHHGNIYINRLQNEEKIKRSKKIKLCKKVISAYCSKNNVLLLTDDGEVYGYGDNYSYQLRDDDCCYIEDPIKLEITNPISIGCGNKYMIYINANQEVFVIGNQHGWPSDEHIIKLHMKATKVICNEDNSVLFTENNEVYLWCDIASGYIKQPFKAIHVSFCKKYAIFILENFDLYGMGYNKHVTNIIYNQECIGDYNYHYTPRKAIYTISGDDHLVIVDENGEIFVGGSNKRHQIGFEKPYTSNGQHDPFDKLPIDVKMLIPNKKRTPTKSARNVI